MSKSDEHILNAIKTWVWSGFYLPSDVHEMIGDILDSEADEPFLRAAVGPEFEKKAIAEMSWPERTDCDRLDDAFEKLNSCGVIALQNTGYTMSDGFYEVKQDDREDLTAYCFYHGQDLERAVAGEGLMLAFGDLDHDEKNLEIGRLVKEALESCGFVVEWNGDPESRLKIPNFDWKRRGRV